MSRGFVLALDLGTTGVRALLVAADGAVAARAYRPLGVAFPAPGRVEQDPEEMWARSLEVGREALREAGVGGGDVAGIGVVTQRATTIAWDARTGRPLAPAIGWQDQRTAERVAWFRERDLPLNTLASATKLEWWLKQDAAVQGAAVAGTLRFGTPDSWLSYRLTGGEAHVTDPGQASCTALFDPAAGSWAAPLLALFGVDEKALPRVVATSDAIGETPADLFGAPIPVAARAGDQQAASFAQGVHELGQAKLTLGTSAMLDLHTGAGPAPPPPGAYPLALWRLADAATVYCLEATVITAGAAVDWLVGVGLAEDAASVDRMAGQVDSAEGVVFVPALQGLGTPFLDDRARGLIGGLTRGSSRAHMARALLEGIAHRLVDLCDALELDAAPLRVDGGLARSEPLLQSLADFGGRTLLRAAETETTALGAAFLAGLAVGVWSDATACRSALAAPTPFAPVLGESDRARARERWREVVERARG